MGSIVAELHALTDSSAVDKLDLLLSSASW